MNVIMILIDSLNSHCLEPYGSRQVQTPSLRRLAERSVVFENHFAGSMPCMPARRELFTGRNEFLWRGWGDVEPWDRHLAAEAASTGAVTQMITDHYHYWERSAHGYFEPFNGVEFVRGHELDIHATQPVDRLPQWVERINRFRPSPIRGYRGLGTAYYANCRAWTQESDFPCTRVMQRSADWLREGAEQRRFFLWIESFDPHEPHHVPEPYRSMYVEADATESFNCWPPYQSLPDCRRFLAEASESEIAWIRGQYWGKVTMVDRWLGRVLDALDEQGLWDTTAVVLTTDHGHDLCWAPNLLPYPWGKQYPHPESHTRIPLMIWHPRNPGRGSRVRALTTAVDVNATLRELLGVPDPDGPHGRSLMPLVRGERSQHRDWVLSGTFGEGAVLTTGQWRLAQGSVGGEDAYWYSSTAGRVSEDMSSGLFIPGIDIPQWRVPVAAPSNPSYLWRRSEHELGPQNLLSRERNTTRMMRDLLRQAVAETGAPPETLRRLGLEGRNAAGA